MTEANFSECYFYNEMKFNLENYKNEYYNMAMLKLN